MQIQGPKDLYKYGCVFKAIPKSEDLFADRRNVKKMLLCFCEKLKVRKKNNYFWRCCQHPAPSGNHQEPKGDQQQPGWDNCRSYLRAECPWPEKEKELICL